METLRIAIELDTAGQAAVRTGSQPPYAAAARGPGAAIELHLLIKSEPRGLRADLATRERWASAYAANANPLAVAAPVRLREIV